MTDDRKQVVVIGGGPGGYPAAFRAADLGMQVTLIDTEANPGGVCLYRGCIPSKTLLHAAALLDDLQHAKEFGIETAGVRVEVAKLRAWKESTVKTLTGGLGQLCKMRKIRFVQGRATFRDSTSVKVQLVAGGEETIRFDHAIIATGARPAQIPGLPSTPRIMDSTGALALDEVPARLLVIGGGYIGLELGQVYAALGSEVRVAEMMPQLLPEADRDLVAVLAKKLQRQMKQIMLETRVAGVTEAPDGLRVTLQDKAGAATEQVFDRILVAAGREPNTANLGLENTRVRVNANGFIEVDARRQTGDPAIMAVGDVAGQPMLAHKATAEGRLAADALAGSKEAFAPAAIPAVVFTNPEVAWCGLTEPEATAKGASVKFTKFPWLASGRARTLGLSDGLTKLTLDAGTERVLGVAIAGQGAGEMIAEGVLAVEMGATAKDLARTVHAHPTLSETMMEAAEAVTGSSTHFIGRKP